MGRTLLLWLLLLSGLNSFSQQRHFLYLQAESGTPFYIRLGDKTFSSTRSGHLIIPNLKDSNYLLTLGIPGNRLPDLDFSLRMNSDKGFEIRQKEGVRLSLYNWQNNTWTNPAASRQTGNTEIDYSSMRTDPYSLLLAGIVNDSAVLFNTIVITPPASQDETIAAVEPAMEKSIQQPVADSLRQQGISDSANTLVLVEPGSLIEKPSPGLKDSLVADQKEIGIAVDTVRFSAGELTEKPSPVLRDSLASRALPDDQSGLELEKEVQKQVLTGREATIRLAKDRVKEEQRELLYIDFSGSKADSIDITIPILPVENAKNVTDADSSRSMNRSDGAQGSVTDDLKTDTGQIDVVQKDLQVLDSMPDSVTKPGVAQVNVPAEPKKLVMINSDCRKFATELEIDKLRVTMLREEGDANRLKAAAKLFKTRCLTVQQVKALSELFSDDDARFNFFEAVYPFVSDSGNFRFLEELLKSDFYRARFRSLLPG